ncbi:MAG: cyclodeaminase/cyclohydrolase family protein [Lachnospiraceae bacterium]|jgi:formiminotetrahydrofolate cyclodeaminase|nr:cyclodeaminase/cyclohydrolase family protein [Lachnospiraceae bacterium]
MSDYYNGLKGFIEDLASDSPAPGGGSVSAISGAFGASLLSMVSRLSIGKCQDEEANDAMKEVLEKSEELRGIFIEMAQADTRAFEEVMKAYALPKSSDEEKETRRNEIQEALKAATVVPLTVAKMCAQLIPYGLIASKYGNANASSDVSVALLQLYAAANGAMENVEINLDSIKDEEFIKNITSEGDEVFEALSEIFEDDKC